MYALVPQPENPEAHLAVRRFCNTHLAGHSNVMKNSIQQFRVAYKHNSITDLGVVGIMELLNWQISAVG